MVGGRSINARQCQFLADLVANRIVSALMRFAIDREAEPGELAAGASMY
jgi:hypothetical protein